MAININNYNDVFGKLTKAVDIASASDNEEIKKIFSKIKEKVCDIKEGGDRLKRDNEILKIGVVGQVKAGKSSFLNSLLFEGENVLPRASTPMTAGLTVLEYGEKNVFSVEYYTAKEWEKFEDKAKEYDDFVNNVKSMNPALTDEEAAKMANVPDELSAAKELISRCTRVAKGKVGKASEENDFTDIKDLQDILENFVGADGQFTSVVKSLTIRLNDERLKGMRIVDTPGVNDPVVSREHRTREFLRECHGVFFLSFASRFFDSTDVHFLTNRIGSQGIGTVVLIASKFDSVLQDSGSKFEDDLGNAIEDCQRQLKAQFRRNLSGSDYRGEEPRFTMSSGIGYSIANKKPSDWDSMESHVVKQMKRFYPSFFASDSDIKATFNELSQIDDIRKDYLDGEFVKNRDKIISSKVNSYFGNATSEIKAILSDGKANLNERNNALCKKDISQIESVRNATLEVVEKIVKDINSLAEKTDNMAEQAMKECWNRYQTPSVRVPTKEEGITFVRQSTFWGRDKDVSCSYKKIDDQKLVSEAESQVQTAAEKLSTDWNNKSSELMNSIKDTIGSLIAEAELKDSEAKLDADGLRRILGEVLASMSNSTVMNVNDLTNNVVGRIMDVAQDCDVSLIVGSVDEATAKNKISSRARETRHKVEKRLQVLFDEFNTDLNTELKKSVNEVKDIFKSRKDELITKAKVSVKGYLDSLEKELKDKKAQLENYTRAIASINEIEKIL